MTRARSRRAAAVALAGAVALLAGCSRANQGAATTTAAPASTTAAPTTTVAPSTSAAPTTTAAPAPCTAAALTLSYAGRTTAQGSNVAKIEILNTSDHPCVLRGPVHVSGLSSTGATVTQTRDYTVASGVRLTPHAVPAGLVKLPPPGEVIGVALVVANYHDDPTRPGHACGHSVLTPAVWKFAFADGARQVANGQAATATAPATSIQTCRGLLETPSPITAEP